MYVIAYLLSVIFTYTPGATWRIRNTALLTAAVVCNNISKSHKTILKHKKSH